MTKLRPSLKVGILDTYPKTHTCINIRISLGNHTLPFTRHASPRAKIRTLFATVKGNRTFEVADDTPVPRITNGCTLGRYCR